MGKMKELHTALQELGQLLRESDPVTFDAAQKFLDDAQAIVLSSMASRPRGLKPREDQLPMPL